MCEEIAAVSTRLAAARDILQEIYEDLEDE